MLSYISQLLLIILHILTRINIVLVKIYFWYIYEKLQQLAYL